MIRILYVVFMLLVCSTQGCISDNEPQGSSISVGEALPSFSVVMNNGETISNSSLTGKVSVIVFFNTDCGDCRKELPVIQQLWEQYKQDESVSIIPIAREESELKIQKYWHDNNLSMPFSPQENRMVYNLFAPSVIPRVYVANPHGIITAIFDDDKNLPSLETLEMAIESAKS